MIDSFFCAPTIQLTPDRCSQITLRYLAIYYANAGDIVKFLIRRRFGAGRSKKDRAGEIKGASPLLPKSKFIVCFQLLIKVELSSPSLSVQITRILDLSFRALINSCHKMFFFSLFCFVIAFSKDNFRSLTLK